MKTTPFKQYFKDGSVCARGQMRDGVAVGRWGWFRKDGTKLRSGCFTNGVQTGEWITYDKQGNEYKKTVIAPKKAAKGRVTLEQIEKKSRT
jgi:antitoxin component YwqK of YwqJK toxin-antitoxin module